MLSSRPLRALTTIATFAMGCNLLLDIGDGSVTNLNPTEDASTTPLPVPAPEAATDAHVADAKSDSADATIIDVDPGAPFVPVNVDPPSYDLNASFALRGSFALEVTRETIQVTSPVPGTLPGVRRSERCGCVVLSVDTWELAKGETAVIRQSFPLVIVARRVVLAGTVIAENTTQPVQYYPAPTDAGADADAYAPPMNGQRAVDGRSASTPSLIVTGTDYAGGGGGGGTQTGAQGGTFKILAHVVAGGQGGTAGDQQVLALGGHGGWGGASCAPGAGGGALQITAREYLELSSSGSIRANGRGAGACPDKAGGGGGAGGMIVLEGRSLAVFGTVAAVGGGGAGGARHADPVAPGNPGQTSLGTERAQGGTGAAGQGGVSQSSGPTAGEAWSTSNHPSGGGGAAGFFLFRHGGTLAVDAGSLGVAFAPEPRPSQLR